MTAPRFALRALLIALAGLTVAVAAHADDALIRKVWKERNPKGPSIDEITKTPISGLYEVRIGTEIFYVDDQAKYILFPDQGHIIDMKTKADLTQARIDKLTAIDVNTLPLKDAMVMKQGTGARRLFIFEDPNCTYCKHLEHELVQLKDVTIYTFLIPILGPDSTIKARDIWCSPDNAHVWRNWMLSGVPAQRQMGQCDFSALDRNLAMADKYRINGTPGIVFEDGSRVPGAIPVQQLEERLAAKAKKS